LNAAIRFVFVAGLFSLAPPARAAEPTDPAELFPVGTLVYASIHDPAAVGPQLAAAFKGSNLEDSIAFIHQRRDKSNDPRDHFLKEQLAVLGLIASPEMAAEFKRLRGIGLGITGFDEQRRPTWAVAVLTGDSSAAGLAARALLTLTSVRKVAVVNGVPVYQFKQPQFGYDPNGRQILTNEKLADQPGELTFAYVPGLFVAGSGKDVLGELLSRFQGKAKDSLATQAEFKDASATYRQPGLFAYTNVPAFLKSWDDSKKKIAPGTGVDDEVLGQFRVLLNAKSMRYLAANVNFRDGGLAVSLGGGFEPGQKSPLLDLLGGPGARVEFLRHAPAPATFAVVVSFPETNRSAAVLGFLDGLMKSTGDLGRTPSEAVKELEAKLKISITDSLLNKTTAATIVLPMKQDIPKGAAALPIVVQHGENPDVASRWAELLPKVLGDMTGGADPQPASETIDGLKVITLPAGNLPWKAAVHCTQKGDVFVLGLDRKLVAAAANGATPAAALSLPTDGSSAVGTVHLGALTRLLTESKPPQGPVVPRGPAAPAKTVPGGFNRFGGDFDELPLAPDATNLPEAAKKSEAAAQADFFKALDSIPMASLAAKRTGADLRIELFQPKVQGGGLAPLVNASVGWFDQVLNRTANPNQGYGPRFGRFRGDW
jgi:hypothetical protein